MGCKFAVTASPAMYTMLYIIYAGTPSNDYYYYYYIIWGLKACRQHSIPVYTPCSKRSSRTMSPVIPATRHQKTIYRKDVCKLHGRSSLAARSAALGNMVWGIWVVGIHCLVELVTHGVSAPACCCPINQQLPLSGVSSTLPMAQILLPLPSQRPHLPTPRHYPFQAKDPTYPPPLTTPSKPRTPPTHPQHPMCPLCVRCRPPAHAFAKPNICMF